MPAEAILLNAPGVIVVRQILLKPSQVEPELGCVAHQGFFAQFVLTLVEKVMHLPEAALRGCRLRSLSRTAGTGMHRVERKMPEDETDRISGLVDDLFELSRINSGALQVTLHTVPLSDVVSDAVAAAAPVAQAKRVRLEAQPSGYGLVRGSEPELGRVLANLLLNAIRHTPSDGVVRVDGGSDATGGWVTVTDECGGIPESDMPRVFDVAFRGAAARSPDPDASPRGGGGLGLAIVRGLVDLHDGDVSVANAAAGCRFTVRLPAGLSSSK